MINNMNLTIDILRRIGTPAKNKNYFPFNFNNKKIITEYEKAYINRIGLLYLSSIPQDILSKELFEKLHNLKERELKTFEVIAGISKALKEGGFRYVIFKSIRPFAFTPNDTDVLVLESPKKYNEVRSFLINYGYKLLGQAPLQSLLYDPAGEGKVNIKKHGGIYYIDLYKAAGSDYFTYLDSNYASTQIFNIKVCNTDIQVLLPELELAVLLFHNVFPENTYHLEHFYLIMYYLYGQNAFNLKEFIRQVYRNNYILPVKANLSITSSLHYLAFGYIPEKLQNLMNVFGESKFEIKRLEQSGFQTPYYFSPHTFLLSPILKLKEWASIKSVFTQAFHMLNPTFMFQSFSSLFRRIKGHGVYEQV